MNTGALVSVDSYMNLQLVNTEEFIDAKFQGNLGEVLIRYSLSSSVMSTGGAHSVNVVRSLSPSLRKVGSPKTLDRRLWISSRSLAGFHRVSVVFMFQVVVGGLIHVSRAPSAMGI